MEDQVQVNEFARKIYLQELQKINFPESVANDILIENALAFAARVSFKAAEIFEFFCLKRSKSQVGEGDPYPPEN